MSSTRWQEIYRSYDADELAAEITRLKTQATLYTQQTFGDKSYTKDLVQIEERLHAAIRVRNERRNACDSGSMIADFSQINHG